MGTNTLCRIAIMANITRWVILYITLKSKNSNETVLVKNKILAAKIALIISSAIIVLFVALWLFGEGNTSEIGLIASFYVILPIQIICYLVIYLLIRSYYRDFLERYKTLLT